MEKKLRQLFNMLFENRMRRAIALTLAIIVTFTTTYALVLPAITLEKDTAETMSGVSMGDNEQKGDVSSHSGEEDESKVDSGESDVDTVSFDAEAKNEDGETETFVHVEADADAFPEGTTMEASVVSDQDVIDSITESAEGEVVAIHAVDLTFTDEDGETVQPAEGSQVSVTLSPGEGETSDAQNEETVADSEDLKSEEHPSGSDVQKEDSSGEESADEQKTEQQNTETAVVQYTEDNGAEAVETSNEVSFQVEPENDLDQDNAVSFDMSEQTGEEDSQTYAIVETVPEDSVKENDLTEAPEGTEEKNPETAGGGAGPEAEEIVPEEQMIPMEEQLIDAEEGVLTAEDTSYFVTVSYGPEAEIPQGASLKVEEILSEEKAYDDHLEETQKALNEAAQTDAGESVQNGVYAGPEAEDPQFVSLASLMSEPDDAGQTESAPAPEPEIVYARFFDITIVDAGGKEVTPAAPVKVSIELLDAEQDEQVIQNADAAQVIHFGEEEPEVMEAEVLEDTVAGVTFDTEGFSVYGVVYTVDFHWEVNGKLYEFSIPGGGFVSLEHLVDMLGVNVSGLDAKVEDDKIEDESDRENTEEADIVYPENELVMTEKDAAGEETEDSTDTDADIGTDADADTDTYRSSIILNNTPVSEAAKKFAADVERVEFSSPDLVWVGKVEEDASIGELKEANGLECEYSAELTEEQIEEINAQTVEAGDWVLISLRPFTSEETLTVTMKNGDQWTVKVTDAQNGSGSSVTAKLIRYQDAFPDGQYVIFTQSGDNYYALTNTGEKVQVNYNKSSGVVTYNGNGSIIWNSQYIGHSGWPNRYMFIAADNAQYLLNPGGDSYNSLLQHYHGYVHMERRSDDNTAAFKLKAENPGTKYLGWSSGTFAATDYDTNSIYLARVEDVSQKYTFTVTVDDPSHGTVSGTNDDGTPTGEVTSFTVTTANVDGDGYGFYDASNRPITATAKQGFLFSHWEVSTAEGRYADDRILDQSIGMASDNVVLKAIFKQDTTVTDEMTEAEIEAQLTAWASGMMSDSVTTNKTAQVKDYNNRIYEITMSAASGIRRVMPTVDLTFITDVSRSMYFPATLQEVATFTQGTANETHPGGHNTATGEWVEADSSLYDWLNRYGDKNTVYYTVADNAAATVMAVYYDKNYNNPADTERTGVWRYYDSSNVNPPDGQNHAGIPVASTGRNEPWGNPLTGKLYTQVGTLNRMDYLKMAAEAASNVVFNVDPDARVGLVTFAASANEGHFYGKNSAFTNALEAVVLEGGTNQGDGLDKGKELFEDNERTDPVPKRVAILITDGAPNQPGVNWGTIGQSAIELKNLYGTDSIELYTLGLSMSMVGENNQNRLKEIATGGLNGGHWAMAEKGSDVVEALKTIIGSIVNEASLKGNITDKIDEAFYPVSGNDGTPLSAGQWIGLNGNKLDTIPADGKYGIITFDGTNFGVQWSDQVVGYSADGAPTWEGKIFVKAKEDFLGGNSINTNAGNENKFVPTKYIVDGEEYPLRDGDEAKLTRTFVTPYVNVDELSMTQNSTEWTVYLGTEVDPKDQIAALLDRINIREVVSSSTDHMITDAGAMLGSSTANNSETFPLKQVLGKEVLSQEEWETLVSQGYLDIPYSRYGHSEVGTLALTLTKAGETANYDSHQTTKTGDSVEQYFLTAHYIPAKKKDVDYRTTPGGSPGALTDNMRSENKHVINVYEVPLDVYKTDESDKALAGATFKLYKVDDDKGAAVTGLNSEHKYTEVASATSGSDGVARLKTKNDQPFGLVPGETYYLIESEAPENYTKVNTVWAVQLQTEVGKFTDVDGNIIHSTTFPVNDEHSAVTADMYPFNWDQGARIMLDGEKAVDVIAKGVTEGSTTTITDGSFVSHKKAISFRHTVKNIGGKTELTVQKTWQDEPNPPDSVTVKLYRVSEKAHHWVEGNVVPCTCTAEGVEEYVCSECKKKDTRVISSAGHTPGESHKENEVAATCTAPGGYDEVVRCTVCNAICSSEHVVTEPLKHIAGSAVDVPLAEYNEHHCYDTVVRCDRCGEELSRVEHDHNWGEWKVTTPAQPGVAGEETRTCDHGHVQTQRIDPLPNTTAITYRFYDYWYNNSYTKTLDVTTAADYTIGSAVTISWTDWEDYNATLYKDQVPSEGDWGNTHYYEFRNLNGVNVTRTGGGWNQSTYSVTVEVTNNMVVDITMQTFWDSGQPQNITITQNRSVHNSAQSLKAMAAPLSRSLGAGALLNAGQPPLLGAGETPESTGQPAKELQTYLDGLKSKEEATCEETEGAVHTYKEEVREVEVKASENWTLSVSDLPKYNEYGNEYTYYVMETSPNSGYAVTYTGQDSGLQAGGRVTINNKKLPPIDLKIIKIDETTRDGAQQKLGAAEFTLYSNTGTTDTSYTVYTDGVKTTSTAEDETYGTLTFEDLPDGQYKIVETGQPDGYVKNEANDIYFDIAGGVLTRYDKAYGEEGRQKISPESEIADITYSMEGNTNAVFTVGNTPGAALPSTGGPGTGMNYLLAVNLICLAGVGFVIKKRWRDPA